MKGKAILLISKIPLSILYCIANFLYIIQQYVFRYRKRTILENLTKSFPGLPPLEIKKIHKRFNHYLCDYVVESIHGLNISQKTLNTRIRLENLAVLEKIKQEKKNTVLLCGHIFNWEWLIGLAPHLPSEHNYAVYHQLNNPFIDKIMRKSRERFNTHPITMKETPKVMIRKKNDGNSTFLFVADQSPANDFIQYELPFLNQQTPVFNGFDRLIRKLDYAAVYIHIEREKRGQYCYRFERINPKGPSFAPNEVVNSFFTLLEKNIKHNPANWLWSHRRWKYKRGIDY